MSESYHYYESMEKAAASALARFEGRVLCRFLIHYVLPEINAVYLVLNDGVFSIFGAASGEVLRIVEAGAAPDEFRVFNAGVQPFAAFSIFLNRRIVQARVIGTAMNGHGFEFSFEGLPEKTMIVQSNDAGECIPGFGDCLRLGVGNYFIDVTQLIN